MKLSAIFGYGMCNLDLVNEITGCNLPLKIIYIFLDSLQHLYILIKNTVYRLSDKKQYQELNS